MRYSDKREPASSAKVHFSVKDVHNFNDKENGGSEVSQDRSHIDGPQSAANFNKPAPFSKRK